MSRSSIAGLLCMVVVVFSPRAANAQEFRATLSGFNEVGALNAETGAILSPGTGSLRLHLDKDAGLLTYELTYADLTSTVLQAHIHFGQIHTPGGIFVFLCTNLGNGPAGTPACPNPGGTVEGTVTAAGVVAVPGQNIPAGDFDAVVAILTSDSGYANVHTNNFKAGEIRGQVRRSHGDDKQH
jgi:CHRD domain